MIRNDTPGALELIGADGRVLALAPLEEREVDEDEYSGFDLAEPRRAGLVSDWTVPPSDLGDKLTQLAMGFGVLTAIACGIVASRDAPEWIKTWWLTWSQLVWIAGGVLLLMIVALGAIVLTKSQRLVMRFIAQAASLGVIVAIGFGLPAATAYFFGTGRELLTLSPAELYVRITQVCFIATASLLPTLLYFLFDRYQLNTIRSRLYRDLFRLNRTLNTRAEIDSEYGSQIAEAYGPENQGRSRLAPGTRWPVLVCAAVVTMGWIATLRPVDEVTAEALLRPLVPDRSTLAFGFLGAYFFGLQLIARRFARGDLKPKAYGYITVRIIVVAVLSWVLEVMPGGESDMMLLLAFIFGILPDSFFTLLREQFRGRGVSRLVPDKEKHPLTRLEGIDLYDRARLEQEGIVNVESLAHHELIHLILETRIPVARIVDWIDQAILYLHVVQEANDSDRQCLRRYGIRTATDLLGCWKAAETRGDLDAFTRLLGDDREPSRLRVIRDAMLDDEWLDRVTDWRAREDREPQLIETAPKSHEAKMRWARHQLEEEQFGPALATFESALELRDTVEVRLELAKLLATSSVASIRNHDAAREHARVALSKGANELHALIELIGVFEVIEDWDSAVRACDAAIEIAEKDARDASTRKRLALLRKKRAELEPRKPGAAAGKDPAVTKE